MEEARKLYDEGLLQGDAPAAQAIGYKELLPYFAGECTLEEAAQAICRNTHRYAKTTDNLVPAVSERSYHLCRRRRTHAGY